MKPQFFEVKREIISEFETLYGEHGGSVSREFLEQFFEEHRISPTLKWCKECRKDITDKAISFWRAEENGLAKRGGFKLGIKVEVDGVEAKIEVPKHSLRDYHFHETCLDEKYERNKVSKRTTNISNTLMNYIDFLIQMQYGDYDTFKTAHRKEPWAMRGKCCVCDNGEGDIMRFNRIVDDKKGEFYPICLEFNEDVHKVGLTEVNEGEPSTYSHYFHKKCFMDLFEDSVLEK